MLKLFQSATKGVTALAYVAMSLMAVVTFIDVVGRVVFNAPLGFAYELVGVLLGVAVYAMLGVACLIRDHIAIDLLDDVWARTGWFNRVRLAMVWLCEAAFFGLLAWFLVKQALKSQRYGVEFLFLPLEKWMPIAIVAGFAIMAAVAHLFCTTRAAKTLAASIHQEKSL